jgi:CDP-diacylglycerol--serine O-phosphatidyltransferase
MKYQCIKNHLPNLLTLCNMAIGLFVICFMIGNNSLYNRQLAIYLVYIAVFLDCLDGSLARYLNVVTDMGKQLDSFSDFITFGIAPIVIFMSGLNSIKWYNMIVLLPYPLAGAYRLARYNLQRGCSHFTGLPITASGFIMVTALLVHSSINNTLTPLFGICYATLALILSVLMISRLTIKRIPSLLHEEHNPS